MIKAGDTVKIPGHRSNINGRYMAQGIVQSTMVIGKAEFAIVHAGVMGLGPCEIQVNVKKLILVEEPK